LDGRRLCTRPCALSTREGEGLIDGLAAPAWLDHAGAGSEPTQVLDGREFLTAVFEDLNRYEATQHFNGQSTISLDGERAAGESYRIAHHLFSEDGERKLMLARLRYGDTFVKLDGAWLFAERNLYVDWIETKPSHP
jgi:hypothetical protein